MFFTKPSAEPQLWAWILERALAIWLLGIGIWLVAGIGTAAVTSLLISVFILYWGRDLLKPNPNDPDFVAICNVLMATYVLPISWVFGGAFDEIFPNSILLTFKVFFAIVPLLTALGLFLLIIYLPSGFKTRITSRLPF